MIEKILQITFITICWIFWLCLVTANLTRINERIKPIFKDPITYNDFNYDIYSEEQIVNFIDNKLTRYGEEEIEDFWYYLATRQELSESFINKYKDKLPMVYIPLGQKVSEKFLIDNLMYYRNNNDLYNIYTSDTISEEVKINLKAINRLIDEIEKGCEK